VVRREEPAAELTIDHLRALRVLGLPRGASPEDIKTAWRDLAKVWHPDRFPSDERLKAKAGENLKRINEAYESLGDYDPAEQPRISARIRASVSVVLGMGELGEPPPQPQPGVPIAPSGPIGVRKSRRILGLGKVRGTGEMEAIEGRAAFGRAALVILLVLVLAAAVVIYALFRRPS
jgi:hypothetical protein